MPLLSVTLDNYQKELVDWFEFNPEIADYLSITLPEIALPTSLSEASWEAVVLHLVPSWNEKGAKLGELDYPNNQIVEDDEIKKVPGWNEKGAKLIHKKDELPY